MFLLGGSGGPIISGRRGSTVKSNAIEISGGVFSRSKSTLQDGTSISPAISHQMFLNLSRSWTSASSGHGCTKRKFSF